ncbi:MAG: hypothetical protein AB4062_14365 [Crocosphaera sp.]
MDNKYKLSIHVDYSNDESSSSTDIRDYSETGLGHAWLELEEINHNSEIVKNDTYGTWNFEPPSFDAERSSTEGSGLYVNAEEKRSSNSSRSIYITEEQANQLQEIVEEYAQEGEDGWGYLTPCSHFASETWEKVTNEKLDHDGIVISTPRELGDSIKEANGGIEHYNQDFYNDICYPVDNNGDIWDEIGQNDELNHNMSYPVDNHGNIWDEIRQDDEFKHEIYEYEPLADLGDIGDAGDGGDGGGD